MADPDCNDPAFTGSVTITVTRTSSFNLSTVTKVSHPDTWPTFLLHHHPRMNQQPASSWHYLHWGSLGHRPPRKLFIKRAPGLKKKTRGPILGWKIEFFWATWLSFKLSNVDTIRRIPIWSYANAVSCAVRRALPLHGNCMALIFAWRKLTQYGRHSGGCKLGKVLTDSSSINKFQFYLSKPKTRTKKGGYHIFRCLTRVLCPQAQLEPTWASKSLVDRRSRRHFL